MVTSPHGLASKKLAGTFGKARLTIWTHKIDGLNEAGFIFAAKANASLKTSKKMTLPPRGLEREGLGGEDGVATAFSKSRSLSYWHCFGSKS